MSRRLNRLWLLPVLLLASKSQALGLGDIRLSSALNEPLRAEIQLLSATPDDLSNLQIQLASSDTFERYGLDRPLFLTSLQFDVVTSGAADGSVVRITSQSPVTEPFITFLVEAVWSRGRLLREYTLLLDPPTFAPPPVAQPAQPVTAPSRSTPADSGRIERPAAQQQPPEPPPPVVTRPAQQSAPTAADPAPQHFDSTPGGDYIVQRGDTLWGITERMRPDNRLSMSQTMLAIFEANPGAFAGNINVLSAGAALRIPSADEVFRISRGDAVAEVRRQNAAWGGSTGRTEPSLTLLPPDGEQTPYDGGTVSDGTGQRDAATEREIRRLERIIEEQESLLSIRDDELASLRDQLARMRGEQVAPPPDTGTDATGLTDDTLAADDDMLGEDDDGVPFEDDAMDDILGADDLVDDGTVVPDVDATQDTETSTTSPPPVVRTAQPEEPGLVDTVLSAITGFWGIVIGALVIALSVLVWFARRAARGDEDSTGVWDALDADDLDHESVASTERLRALAQEDDSAIVVVEGDADPAADETVLRDTLEAPAVSDETRLRPVDDDPLAETGTSETLEDTFSSETAINLDQSDPIAEADFHMAYGLYDQAADLINGALGVEPERQDLLAKLCEIYFVWGNRDAFIDAATRMQATVDSDQSNPEWDKIVIMGQQIAGDHELFSGVSAAAATKAVDLSFDGAMDETSALDMELGSGADGQVSDVIDLGAESAQVQQVDEDTEAVDFMFDEPDLSASVTQEMPPPTDESPTIETPADDDVAESDTIETAAEEATAEMPAAESTAEMPAAGETTETPTIEQQFAHLDATGELPQVADDEATEVASLDDEGRPDATAEIDLDDLGLDLDGLAETQMAADVDGEEQISDLDDTSESATLKIDDLEATGTNEALEDDALAATGKNPELDVEALSDATGMHEGLDVEDALAATAEMPGVDEPSSNMDRALPDAEEPEDEDTDVGIDTSLLDATGQTQILSDDLAVDTATDVSGSIGDDDKTLLAPLNEEDEAVGTLSDEAETLLAPMDDEDEMTVTTTDDGDFDFAKTEALPKDVFTGETSLDETGELPAPPGSTDMDLDLDDLTAALKVSEMGDTVNQQRDEATVEHPRIQPSVDMDVGDIASPGDDVPTAKIAPEDMSEDLHDARTMTEVGTKLDLARAYVDMGDPGGARSILEEVLDEGDESQRQQAQQLLDSLPG